MLQLFHERRVTVAGYRGRRLHKVKESRVHIVTRMAIPLKGLNVILSLPEQRSLKETDGGTGQKSLPRGCVK